MDLRGFPSIIGSETEFGLVSSRVSVFRILDKISGLTNKTLFTEEVARRLVRANWWEETLTPSRHQFAESEKSRLLLSDAFRCLGFSGSYLANGARLYVDGSHLEYSTPECLSPLQLIAYERAGERIAFEVFDLENKTQFANADLLKRNCDYGSASYACHENYLTSRRLFNVLLRDDNGSKLSAIRAFWVLHLISRQIFTGSGAIISGLSWPKCFAISQRQRFIETLDGLDTMHHRPIVNTRDRPYADPKRFGRLHVICGDSNRADQSNYLKYGTARLVLMFLEHVLWNQCCVVQIPIPIYPVEDFRSVTDKESLVRTEDGTFTALDLQIMIFTVVEKWSAENGIHDSYPWVSNLVAEWRGILESIGREDCAKLSRTLDYYIKRSFFEERMSRSNASTRALQRLEYQYHRLGEKSLFRDLVEDGRIEELIGEDDIRRVMKIPPETRALTRSKLQQFFSDRVLQIAWHFLAVFRGNGEVLIRMPDPSRSDFDTETFGPRERAQL